jgi:biotin transport system substrate-specific component
MLNMTYADVLRPGEKTQGRIYDIAMVIGGSLLIAACAQVAVWPAFSPVPITGQTFAVLMVGALLGGKRGSLAVLAYIAEGILGLPVFASARAGLAVILGPTGGYLIGFVAAAYVVGRLCEKGWDRNFSKTIMAMVLGNICIYAGGLFWLGCLTGFGSSLLSIGLYPFLPGEVAKVALAAAILPSGWKLLKMNNFLNKS